MIFRKVVPALIFAAALCVSTARAQEAQPSQQPQDNPAQAPIPPEDTTPANEGNHQMPAAAGQDLASGLNDTGNDQPDTRPVAGMEAFGLGSRTGPNNMLDFALHEIAGVDTAIFPGQTAPELSVGGSVSVNHSWERNQFVAQYVGGESLYLPTSVNNNAYHDLSAAQTFQWGRTILRLRDDFLNSSGPAFGTLNVGGPGLTTLGTVTSLTQTVLPTGAILTGTANQIGDSALVELDYALNRRSTVTVAGAYGLLHFLTPGYVNSQDVDGRAGYSYLLDRKNSIGFSYDYNVIDFSGAGTRLVSDVGQVAYGRKITGRTALKLSGGPQAVHTQSPGTTSTWQWSWSVFGSLAYQARRNTYSATYSRGVTNGSGVFLGAESDTVSGGLQTQLSRFWTASFSGGYSRNSNFSLNNLNFTPAFYGTWYGTASVGRLWNRIVQTNASYALQRQTTNSATCPVLNCGPSTVRQVVTITVNWHFGLVGLE